MTPSAMLILIEGAGTTAREWSLDQAVTHIGRMEGSEVVLPDREVSRKHAQIRQDGIHHILVDLGSKNGTLVNGIRVESSRRLVDGDEIIVPPRFQLRFVDNEATAAIYRRPRGVRVDPVTRTVALAGKTIEPALAPNQFALLLLLMQDYGRVYSRQEIAEACYPGEAGGVSDQAIDGLVRRLRARLAEADPENEYVQAVRGHGFQMIG